MLGSCTTLASSISRGRLGNPLSQLQTPLRLRSAGVAMAWLTLLYSPLGPSSNLMALPPVGGTSYIHAHLLAPLPCHFRVQASWHYCSLSLCGPEGCCELARLRKFDLGPMCFLPGPGNLHPLCTQKSDFKAEFRIPNLQAAASAADPFSSFW